MASQEPIDLANLLVKGSILGAVVYFGSRFGMSETQLAVLMPFALVFITLVFLQIGDK